MERLDTHVCSVDTTLQQAPKVFESVGVNASVDVFNGVVNNPVCIASGDFPVAALTNPGKSEDTLQDAKRMLNLALTWAIITLTPPLFFAKV